MTDRPLLFDAVLFDLDGTLVATDQFWVQAARTGARKAFRELALDRPPPTAEEWMGIVGLAADEGFRGLFPDLDERQLSTIVEACTREERRLLEAGGAAPMPGTEDTLARLRTAGIRMGIASNCSQGYLDHMVGALGLSRHVEEALCLDSPGIHNKADMVERLLERFDTRSAVMVGDRAGDRDAAWENGLPHVHCAFGFAARGEAVEAEARIEDLGELLSVLGRRGEWIAEALHGLGLSAASGRPPSVLGVTGDVAAGKTLFARDAARLLSSLGTPAVAVSLEAFRNEAPAAPDPAEFQVEQYYDLDRLETSLLEPHSRGRDVGLEPRWLLDPAESRVRAGEVLVLDGPFLLDPRLRSRMDKVVYLTLPEELAWRRLAGRDARARGPEALQPHRELALPRLQAHRERYAPERLADRLLDGANPLGEGRPDPTGVGLP